MYEWALLFNFEHYFYDNIVIELDATKNNLKVD